MPTHKYFMLHYVAIAKQNYAGDEIFRSDSPKEMLEALKSKYQRTLQKAQIYGVFCFDEETQGWKGFDYDGAVEYLEKVVAAM